MGPSTTTTQRDLNGGGGTMTQSMHPECENYSAVYDAHGLFHNRAYMAHCVHCGSAERELVLRKGVGVVSE